VLMSLSRLQRNITKRTTTIDNVQISSLKVQAGLCAFTYSKTAAMLHATESVVTKLLKQNAFATVTVGTNQITVIADASHSELIDSSIRGTPMFQRNAIASVGISFDERYIQIPGFLATLLQQLMIQHINLIEISSTFTEFIVYVDEQDMKLTFDTLSNLFTVTEK